MRAPGLLTRIFTFRTRAPPAPTRAAQLLYRLDARDAEMGIAQAELSVRQAQKSYDDLAANLTVRSGGAGVVQQVLVQRGDLVSPGTPVAEVADASVLSVVQYYLHCPRL